MRPPSPDQTLRARRRTWWIPALVLALAAVLRFLPIPAALPYSDYIDEGHTLHQARNILQSGTLDVRWYGYPSLTAQLIAGALTLGAPFYRLAHGHSFWADLPPIAELQTPAGLNYDLLEPAELIWVARLVTALLSLGTVALAGALAARLGGRRAGWIALLLTACCPALVARSSQVMVDTTAAFFVTLTLFLLERFCAHQTVRRAALCGAAAGLAFGSKYPAGAVLVAVGLGLVFTAEPRRRKILYLLTTGGAFLAAAVCASPPIVWRTAQVLEELRHTGNFYLTLAAGPSYLTAALGSDELGWTTCLLLLAGALWMFRRQRTRPTASRWLAFTAVFLAPLAAAKFQPFRNLLPLLPLLLAAGGVFLAALARRLPGRATLHALLLAALFAAPMAFASASGARARLAVTDTRVQAVDWLRQQARPGQTVLAIRELAILPSEWRRQPATVTLLSAREAVDLLASQRFDFYVLGEIDQPPPAHADPLAGQRERWEQAVARLRPAVEFGRVKTPTVPFFWRTNDQRVRILHPPDR